MRPELLDIEIFPPFAGFPKQGMKFLNQLKKNNNREWFAKHKPDYEDFVKLPMQSLIGSLQAPMAKIAPEFEVHPRRSMFRIYRDIRFSNNKAPYKTHVAAVFHRKGHWQHSAGFYVGIEPGSVDIGGGIYMPDSKQLKKIRTALVGQAKEFLTIMEEPKFRKRFEGLHGEKLKRIPQGFPADHWMAEWLKYKSFYTGDEWGEDVSYSPKFVDKIVGLYKDLLPLVRFLNNALEN